MTSKLDELVREAAPFTDAEVRALALDEVEDELRAAIVDHPRHKPARRSRRRIRLPRLALSGLAGAAVAGAAVLAITLAGGGDRLGTRPERAWAASAVRVANAVPRLLIAEPGWTVTRADEFRVSDGEMTFRARRRAVDLHWRSGSFRDWVSDRAKSGDALPSVSVLGTRATVFRYRGPFDAYTALWRDGRYTMELRTSYPHRLSLDEYRRVLRALRSVSVDAWLSAMPPSVVLPANTGRAIDAMLAGIPLPPGFDRSALKRRAVVRDRYQLGARVAGAVACGWIERWVAARRAGDAAAAGAAVRAMNTSHRWEILREMNAKGDYPEVLWELADAMKSDTPVPAGRTANVEETYRSALGC